MDSVDVHVASEHSNREGTPQRRSATLTTIERKNIKTEQVDEATKEVFPYVCGICSEKFEKISPFYAHLKTHSSFESQTSKKNDMLNALDVGSKVDENIFRCGICLIEFPTMSLLHDHMVLEENMTNYQYSNDDHTARPNQRAANGRFFKVKSPAKSTESSKRKVSLALEADVIPVKKKKHCDDNDTLVIELGKKSFVSHSTSSPSTRSSSRISRSTKRVDYKALAGIVTPKVENDNIEGQEVQKDEDDTSINLTDEEIQEDKTNSQSKAREAKRIDRTKSNVLRNEEKATSGVEKTTRNAEKLTRDVEKTTRDVEKTNRGVKKPTRDVEKTTTDVENTSEQTEPITETEEESGTDITTSTENDADLIKDIKTETDSGKFKEDGTCATGTLSLEVVSVSTEIFEDEDLADNDSDDDFLDIEDDPSDDIEDGPYDDTQDDPNYEVVDPYDDDDPNDHDYNLLNDLKDRREYLKKHGLKTKQRRRKIGGKLISNCLYPCSVCGKYFVWKALKKHSYAHIKVKKTECPKCGKKYKSKRHLGDHIRSVHSMAKYRCGLCGDMLKGKQGFEKHATLHVLKNETGGCMDDITMVEVTEEEYKNWRQSSNKREAYKNRKQPAGAAAKKTQTDAEEGEEVEVFKGPIHGQGLELDKDLVGGSSNVVCKVCSKQFLTHDSMKVHLLKHKEDTQFQCDVCQAFFLTNQHLENHIADVHGQSKHVCDVCGERFKNMYAMWSHKGKHLTTTDPYYSEDIIERLQAETKARKAKRKLMKKLPVKKTECCEICGQVILTHRMKRHKEIHKDTKEWKCDICQKFYKTRRYLIDHQRKTHFADITTCEICGQTFKGKAYLDIHRQIHGPRDKMCPYCDKGFTTNMYLKAHLNTHKEKKQYKCDSCPAAFSHKQRLHIHKLENHQQGEGRPCKYCGELFPSREKARKHERRIHEGIRYRKSKPIPIRREPGEIGILEIDVSDEQGVDTQNRRIVQFIPPELIPSIKTGNKSNSKGGKNMPQIVKSDIAEAGQFIKFENGDEYELMLEGGDGEEPVEVIELSEEQHNVFIQETSEEAIAAQSLQVKDENNIEQVLEIPENAEQCQILLFPDGTFKLLNVVDNTASS